MRVMLVIDRGTGATERIREDDTAFASALCALAEQHNITFLRALARLDGGETMATASYLRRLEQ